MHGIDTCEMTSKDPAVKALAIKARNRLIQLATGADALPEVKSDKDIISHLSKDVHLVWVECLDFDKYARPLVKLMRSPSDTKTFTDILIEEKLAYPYFGATKLSEQAQNELLS
jgi:endonuclease YncB( thermonuclease family)